jgi:hypothetical protein
MRLSCVCLVRIISSILTSFALKGCRPFLGPMTSNLHIRACHTLETVGRRFGEQSSIYAYWGLNSFGTFHHPCPARNFVQGVSVHLDVLAYFISIRAFFNTIRRISTKVSRGIIANIVSAYRRLNCTLSRHPHRCQIINSLRLQ